ncbi:MAG: putative hydrolase [Myxococcaceae bacterium]|nr:putative hydrolase [Myxococcaceae bacterium]
MYFASSGYSIQAARSNKLSTIFALALTVVSGSSASSSEAQAIPAGKVYVSFGDSYASGPGLTPYNDESCQRSQYNWPSRLAWNKSLWPERTGPWADYSCFGAQIMGSTAPATPSTSGGFPNSLKDQIDWAESSANPSARTLGAATTLVTISIGGNDLWGAAPGKTLYGALKTCDAPGNCDTSKLLQPADVQGQTLGDRLRPQLERIHALAPSAKIELVGYPSVIPAATVQNCAGYYGPFQTWSFSPEDQAFLRQLFLAVHDAQVQAVAQLNTLASIANSLTFVDLRTASLGHDICAGSNAWIAPPGSTTPQELHPSQAGMNAFGDAVFAQ